MLQLPKPQLKNLTVIDKPTVKSEFMKVSDETVKSQKIMKVLQTDGIKGGEVNYPIFGLVALIAMFIIIRK